MSGTYAADGTAQAPLQAAAAPGMPDAPAASVDDRMLRRLAAQAAVPDGNDPLEVEAPFTGEILGAVPRGTAADMAAACAAARGAQPAWAALSFDDRAAVMLRFHDLLLANANEILDLIQLEVGKARVHAFTEVFDAAVTARYYAHTAEDFLRSHRRQGVLPVVTQTRELLHPRGVIGFITPWNFPLVLSISDAIPALMAGNTAVVKPDSQSPFTLLWAVALLREAGLPEEVLQVVPGSGAELGPPLIDAVDYLMFTGSTATGSRLAQAAAARLIDYGMELGGKNAAIVLDDAPHGLSVGKTTLGISTVAGLAFGISAHAGQVCVSCERLFVQDGIYDDFVPRLVSAVQGMRMGDGLSWDHDLGSLASADQLAKVEAHVGEAVSKGARILAGGRARPDLGPYFYEPTLLEGVDDGMAVCVDETFGPVASIYRFRDVDDAIVRVNDCSYGLNASVWTRDVRRGREIAARIQAGTVGINDAYQAAWGSMGSPMGGHKMSGVGRRHGRQGIVKYTEAQTVAVQRLTPLETIPFLDHKGYATALLAALRVLKRMPGIH